MPIRIEAGDVSVEKKVPTAQRIPESSSEPLYMRRKLVLEAIVRNRRQRFTPTIRDADAG